ncbi:MAG: trypsin-like peptidase domain-containing protein [Alphaproteobacteria bacterium]|nr:trypsin-like peptidase domain-containing protein [Alphaproteobacteria bacterium]
MTNSGSITLNFPSLRARWRSRLLVAVAAAGLLGGALAAAPPALARESFAELARTVSPAVVNVAVVQAPGGRSTIPRRFGQQQPPPNGNTRALGSGFIIDPTGYIVTNSHVVGNPVEVRITMADGREFPARVVGQDELTDLAVLKIDATEALPSVAFGDSQRAQVGDWVIAVGNPFGLGGTVTAGIISARSREIGAGPYDDFIQLDAAINSGNSGGPLFNMEGQVIGVNTAIFSPSGGSVGLGFAIPSTIVQSVVQQLREQGRVARGWLGVSMDTRDAAKRAPGVRRDPGVRVSEVQPGSPAQRAGIRVGDVILRYNDREIQGPRHLAWSVAETRAGEQARIVVRRDGREETINVTIAQQPAQVAGARTPEPGKGGNGAAPRNGGPTPPGGGGSK